MLTAILCLPLLLVSAPLEWRCHPDLYGDGYACDCGCGLVDPDCERLGDGAANDFAFCATSFCAPGMVPQAGSPSQCAPGTCGDGFVGKGELCDDGAGVGCDDTCQVIADGYRCSGLGAGCSVPSCGDRIVDLALGETCDDGNAVGGDGCDGCAAEAGWVCRLFGGCTVTSCGDFNIEWDWETRSGETCEDGNTAPGDGCSASCRTEEGWACRWDGCFPVACGDGFVARGDFGDGEQCDDGGLVDGDGCDASCLVEPGWYCDDFMGCARVECGDLVIAPGEMCDDGDAEGGDGCSDTCQSEPGWSCGWAPGACTEVVCGDGRVMNDDTGTFFEECDDGNTLAGDGCGLDCRREPGYVCGEAGCRPIVCGDGYVDSELGGGGGPRKDAMPIPIDPGPGGPPEGGPVNEQCDDGNADAGDGCSAACTLEEGWLCDLPGRPCVRPVCGDGKVEGVETCDDGNDLEGDGCSVGCLREPGYVCREPGRACEPMPTAWVCSLFVYGVDDGCDCGCGARDPDCPEAVSVADCDYNHCLDEAPWPTSEDPTTCGTEPPPPADEGPEVVEEADEVEADVVEPGPEDASEGGPEAAEAEPAVPPRTADDGCGAGGVGGWVGLWLLLARVACARGGAARRAQRSSGS